MCHVSYVCTYGHIYLYHLESRCSNSYVLAYHGPLQKSANLWELRHRHLLSVSYTHKIVENIHPQKLTWMPHKSPGPSLMQGTSSANKNHHLYGPVVGVLGPCTITICRLSGGRQIPFHGSSTPLGCSAVSWYLPRFPAHQRSMEEMKVSEA